MRNTRGLRLAGLAGCLLLTLAAANPGAGQATETPIRDRDGNDIGSLDRWHRVRLGGKRFLEPEGWVGMHNGKFGLSLFSQVRRGDGFALKGSVERVRLHGDPFDFQPTLSAGRFDSRNEQLGSAAGVPIDFRPAFLKGEYRFKAYRGSSFRVSVRLFRDDNEVGQGFFSTKTAASAWTPFEVPINYFSESVPDRVFVILDLWGRQSGNRYAAAVKGTSYHVDSLRFSD
jgi:hypothetical protein